jgi:hypothetical protein
MNVSGTVKVLGISFNNINPTKVVNFYKSSTLELQEDDWSASSLSHFIPRKKPQYPLNTCLGISCSQSGCFRKEKYFGPHQEFNHDYFVIQPMA